MNIAKESSAHSEADRRESVSEFQSLIVLGDETALVNVNISKGGLKCQRVMLSDMPNWEDKIIRSYIDVVACYQSSCLFCTFSSSS